MSLTFLQLGSGNLARIQIEAADDDGALDVNISSDDGDISMTLDDIDAATRFVTRLGEAVAEYRAKQGGE